MTDLDRAIAAFRDTLTDHQVTFLLVYSVQNPLTQTIDTRITSNSNQLGIRAIMACICRPTREALILLSCALYDTARAACNTTADSIDKAAREGTFEEGAEIILEKLRGFWTIAGWERPDSENSGAS
jgi:hypothetical protein